MGVTTTSDDTEPQDGGEPRQASRFWHLGDDDKRLLFITFVGGLAANVGVVLIIGLGLLAVHQVEHAHDALLVLGVAVLVTVVLILLRVGAARLNYGPLHGALLVRLIPTGMMARMVVFPGARARLRDWVSLGALAVALRMLTVLTVLASLAVAILILALVGISAGIK
jgi:hypothetical protein